VHVFIIIIIIFIIINNVYYYYGGAITKLYAAGPPCQVMQSQTSLRLMTRRMEYNG